MKKEDLVQTAYEKGLSYEARATDCCQSTVAAIQDTLNCKNDMILKAGSPIAGGLAFSLQGTCGALVGAALVMGQLYGRTRKKFDRDAQREINDPDFDYVKATKGWKLAYEIFERFIIEYGSPICYDISDQVIGRVEGEEYIRPDSPATVLEAVNKKRNASDHSEEGCPKVVGNAAKWATEIILREGIPDSCKG